MEIRQLEQAGRLDERVESVRLHELDILGADLFRISDKILDLDTNDPTTLRALAMVVMYYLGGDPGLPQEAAIGLARGVLEPLDLDS